MNQPITAHHDPALSAVLLTTTPLRYSAGADPALDRPAHVRAGSELALVGQRLMLIQDDAHFLARVDPHSGNVDALPLPPGADGQRLFGDYRGNKKLKFDLEACLVVPGAPPLLVAFGSGSQPARECVLLVNDPDGEQPDIRLVQAARLYAGLHAATLFAGSELNIEGAIYEHGLVRLFNRGNGAPRGELRPIDATCELDLAMLLAYLEQPDSLTPPAPTGIVQYDLGLLDGQRLTFTGAIGTASGVLFTAAAEASPDAFADGPVSGSALGIITPDGSVRHTPLILPDGTIAPFKVEGVERIPGELQRVWIIIDPDDHTQPTELGVVELNGPWFASHPNI